MRSLELSPAGCDSALLSAARVLLTKVLRGFRREIAVQIDGEIAEGRLQ